MHYFRHTFLILIISICYLTVIANARVITILSSNHLVTEETCYLTYIIDPSSEYTPLQPKIDIPDTTIDLYSSNRFRRNGRLLFQFTYSFRASKEGVYTIPATVFSQENNDEISESATLTVKKQSSLHKKEIISTTLNKPDGSNAPRKIYPYYTQLVALKSSLYPNEVTNLEYKIYVPRDINIAQWGLPTGIKVNATAWRFETPRAGNLNGIVKIDDINYQVGTFHTTVSGVKPGQASIGPFKNRLVHNVPIISSNGLRSETQKMHLESDAIHLNIRSLPPEPPANFKGDVGRYSMSLDIETKSEISSSESIKAKIILNGTGKFSELSPPDLTDDEHWKLISQSKRELGNQRKSINGFAEFDYLIQPTNTGPATSTPGFSFSYLDPDLEDYTTINYPGVPIKINLTSNTNGDNNNYNNSSTSNSDQILGIIENINLNKQPWYKTIPLSLIHIIPALFCIFLICILAKRKFIAYRLNQSHKIIQSKTLKEINDLQDEDFLKAASNYVQRWVNIEKHPEFKEIQELRDGQCYKPNSPVKISSKRKQSIIDSLKKLMILLLCFTPFVTEASTTANEHYEQGKFQHALKEYQSILEAQPNSQSADLLYNIGNCYQKLNKPAQAAIHYHRALHLDSYHTRASHNLAIIQNDHSSIIANNFIKKYSLAYWLNSMSQQTYYIIMSLALWLIIISLLWIFIMKPREQAKIILICSSVAALCIAILSYCAHIKHPDTDKIPNASFAIITNTIHLLEQPITNSSSLMDISIASECRIISVSGTYSYIELPDINKTQGWVTTDSLIKLKNDM